MKARRSDRHESTDIAGDGVGEALQRFPGAAGHFVRDFSGRNCLLSRPNGAGKSTTINILAALLRYDGGEIRFQGERVEKHPVRLKESLGIVPQDIAIYENIPAEANVRFFASLYGLRGEALQRAAEEALDFVGLSGRKRRSRRRSPAA